MDKRSAGFSALPLGRADGRTQAVRSGVDVSIWIEPHAQTGGADRGFRDAQFPPSMASIGNPVREKRTPSGLPSPPLGRKLRFL